MLSALACSVALSAQPLVPRSGMVITQSSTFQMGTYRLTNSNEDGTGAAITIKGDNIQVDFKGATLEGSAQSVPPNERKGTAIKVEGQNVVIRNVRVRGFKIGLIAVNSPKISVVDCDFSYNWKQHLKSTLEKEDLSDWMSFHKNEKDEWLQFGAGIYLRKCDEFKVRGVKITGGQCGLMVTECNQGIAFNNDFSFLSAIGLGMYRSSECLFQSNKIDWCVRGYSHGKYNRGQDSAGILIYEQSHKNIFAYNSVTHGGDGFFLWAGQTTMDTGQGGCNDNLLYGNDFSHAPTNGIEATFSRNTFVNNLIQECWHGIWGGYSFNTDVIGNKFAHNAESIAIEHGQDNRIIGNRFSRERMGLNIWQNATQDPNWGYPKARDTRSRDYTIKDNVFEDIAGPVLRFRGLDRAEITGNQFRNNGALTEPEPDARSVRGAANRIRGAANADIAPLLRLGDFLTTDLQVDPSFKPRPSTMQPSGNVILGMDANTKDYLARFDSTWNPFKKPTDALVAKYVPKRIGGSLNPMLKGGVLRGRRYILVDEWGPYDFRSPRLWPRESSGNTIRFEVLGPRGKWRVSRLRGMTLSSSEGQVPGFVSATIQPGKGNDVSVELEYIGKETKDYRGIVTAAGQPVDFGWSKFVVPVQWDVSWFNYDSKTQDPRTQYAAFRTAFDGQAVRTEKKDDLGYDWWNSPGQGVNQDYFATKATGNFEVDSGEYQIEVTADDGVRVWLDDRLLIDEWHYSPPAVYSAKVKLGGRHKIRIEQFELNGFSCLKFALKKL